MLVAAACSVVVDLPSTEQPAVGGGGSGGELPVGGMNEQGGGGAVSVSSSGAAGGPSVGGSGGGGNGGAGGSHGSGICGTRVTTGSEAVDACYSDSCCPAFDACRANAACVECMDGIGANCSDDPLYQSLTECVEGNCPSDMCDTGIGYSDPMTGDPDFDCHVCATTSCCIPLLECIQDGSQVDVSMCVDCLNEDTACDAAIPEVQVAAVEFLDCIEANCMLECPP